MTSYFWDCSQVARNSPVVAGAGSREVVHALPWGKHARLVCSRSCLTAHTYTSTSARLPAR